MTEVDTGAALHQVTPLDAHEGTFRCTYCGNVFTSESGWAICPLGQLHGARVRILAPEGHPLHQATGTVTMVISTAEMWAGRPMIMMGEPLAWPDGQVLVSLDQRPPVPHRNDPDWLWTPVITVRPGQVELLGEGDGRG